MFGTGAKKIMIEFPLREENFNGVHIKLDKSPIFVCLVAGESLWRARDGSRVRKSVTLRILSLPLLYYDMSILFHFYCALLLLLPRCIICMKEGATRVGLVDSQVIVKERDSHKIWTLATLNFL